MIFKIDESCLKALNANDDEAISALETLALNRRRCRNIIFAEKWVLENLMKKTCFSNIAKGIYTSLFNNSSEDKLYFDKVNKYINIVTTFGEDRISIVSGKEVCAVTLEEISKFGISDLTELITENFEDAKMYKTLGKYYAMAKGMNRFFIDFDFKMGGGDTTVNTLDLSLQKRDKLCLCIVDSDRKFPSDVPGQTMRRVKSLIQGKIQDIWKTLFLNVHEVENLLPLKWVEKTSSGIPTSKESIAFLKFLFSKYHEGDKSIYFFDYKNGLKREKFVCVDESNQVVVDKFRKSTEFRKHWRNYIEEYGIKIEDIKGDHIIPGVCKNILSKVLLDYEESFKIDDIEEHIENEWLTIGRDIFSWGCVGHRIAG